MGCRFLLFHHPAQFFGVVHDMAGVGNRPPPPIAQRELIKRAWGVDPLLCPKCGGQMRLISLIEDAPVIEKILRHLDLWEGLALPLRLESEYIWEPFYDDLPFSPDACAA
ncbi:MAG: hypothetical protein FJ395_11325 [Verrucomicrobia bacterium]|nr:hypothetical protein [Verrucomicrobiota bacterium]